VAHRRGNRTKNPEEDLETDAGRDRRIAAVILAATVLIFFSDLAPTLVPLIAIVLLGAAVFFGVWATPAVRAQINTIWPPPTLLLVLVFIADSLGFIVTDRSMLERGVAIGLNVVALSCVIVPGWYMRLVKRKEGPKTRKVTVADVEARDFVRGAKAQRSEETRKSPESGKRE
jgi:hypothetical protein